MALKLQQLHVENIKDIQDGTIDFCKAGPVLGLYPLSQTEPAAKVADILNFMREIMNRGQTEGALPADESLATYKQLSQIELRFAFGLARITYQIVFTETDLEDDQMNGVQVVHEKVCYQETLSEPVQILLDYRNPDLAKIQTVAQHIPFWHLTPEACAQVKRWYLLKQLQQEIEYRNCSFLFSWGCDNLLSQKVLPCRLRKVRDELMDWLREICCYTFHETSACESAFPLPNDFLGLTSIAMTVPDIMLEGDYREARRIVRQVNCILAVLRPDLKLDLFQNKFHHCRRVRINTQQGPALADLPLSVQHVIFCLGGLVKAYHDPNALVILPRAALDVPLFNALMAVMVNGACGQVIFTAADTRLMTSLRPSACVLVTNQKKAHYQPWTIHAFPVQPAEKPCVSLSALHKAFEQAPHLHTVTIGL